MALHLIILAGGFGTRLKPISKSTPKALMPVGDYIYLDLLLDRIIKYNIDHCYLSLHYKPDLFLEYINSSKMKNILTPIIEPEPLGTGGAINYVIQNFSISSPFFTINGDSLSDINLDQMVAEFKNRKLMAMMGISELENVNRYGMVIEKDGDVLSFKEKDAKGSGWINNGHYIFKKEAFDGFSGIFSLENELFPKLLQNKDLGAFRVAKDNFIDMGIAEEYFKLNERGFINYENEKSNP